MGKILVFLRSSFIKFVFCLVLPSKKIRLTPDKVKRILIYAQMGIGNMVMFTPLVRALRSYFKNSQIILLFLSPNGAEQVLAGSTLVDETIVWDIHKLSYLQKLKAIAKMAQWKPDLVISRFHSYNIYFILTTLLSRAPYRVGHVTSGGWVGKFDYLNNYPVKMGDNEHEIIRYLRLAADIGIPSTNEKPVFYIGDDDDESARVLLKRKGISPSDQFITVHMTSSPLQRWKQWHIEKWMELLEILINQKVKPVILGSADEREMVIKATLGLSVKPIFALGELTLKQTAAVIKKSAVLVCNDSGLMHIGVAVDTPVVAIFGPQDYKRVVPLDNKHTIIRKNYPCSPCIITFAESNKNELCKNRSCLQAVEVSEVMNAVFKYIKTEAVA